MNAHENDNPAGLSRREFMKSGGALAAGLLLPVGGSGLLSGCSDQDMAAPAVALPPIAPASHAGKVIQTVRGPILPAHLGFTSIHEHLLIDVSIPEIVRTFGADAVELFLGGDAEVPAHFFPGEDHRVTIENLGYLRHGYYEKSLDNFDLNEELMTAELIDFAKVGGRSVVDCNAPFPRPDPKTLRRMSEASGVNILMSTGLSPTTAYWPPQYREMSVKELIAYIEDEMENGIDGFGVKPAQIKSGVDGSKLDYAGDGIRDPHFRRLLEAASQVSANTGIMVVVHIDGATVEEQREICAAARRFGMPPERMVMAHFQTQIQEMRLETLVKQPESFALQLDLARELLDQGFVACIDCFGMAFDHEHKGTITDEDTYKIAAIYHLIAEGYGDQLVIGTDVYMKLMTRRFGGHGIIRLLNFVVPVLQQLGVAQTAIDKITTGNPARLLAY